LLSFPIRKLVSFLPTSQNLSDLDVETQRTLKTAFC